MRFSIQPPRLLRSKEARKNKSAQISNLTLLFIKKLIALIHKNVIEMFLRCTVYELWFNLVCRFCMDPTVCYVVWVSNQKLDEQLVCSRFAWRYSLFQYKRTLAYLGSTTKSSILGENFLLLKFMKNKQMTWNMKKYEISQEF